MVIRFAAGTLQTVMGSGGIADSSQAAWTAGLVDRGVESDLHAGVEPLQLADLVAGLAAGVETGVVVRAEFDEPDAGAGDDQAGDLADGAGDRDDGFLFAAAAGDTPVPLAGVGAGPGGGHDRAAERGAQVGVALAGPAGLGGGAGLDGAAGQPGPGRGVAGSGD